MSTRRPAWMAALAGFVLLICGISGASAERRVALVVGNANYSNPSLVLSNPKNDAEDVAVALRAVGFEVMQAIDTNKRDLDANMAKFARLATDADAALFYYAGHALQFQGRNYLMPTDAEVDDEVSLRYQMMLLDDVRAALDRASGVKIMILDACRNNPVVETLRRKSGGESRAVSSTRGLARIDKTQGMVVAYSTAADQVAADGKGRNSPFTTAFLKRLKEPGLEIEQLFRRVAADVNTETGGRQRPETYVSLLSDYYLNQTDRVAYDEVKDSPDPLVLRTFISRFPSSSFVSDALSRIQAIETATQQRQALRTRQEEAARQLEEKQRAEREADRQRAERQLAERQKVEQQTAALERERLAREAELRQKAEVQQRPQQQASAELPGGALARSLPGGVQPPALQPSVQPPLQTGQNQTKLAGVERQDVSAPPRLPEPPALTPPPPRLEPPATPALPAPTSSARLEPPAAPIRPEPATPIRTEPAAPATGDCDSERATLTRLRSNPVLEDIAQFERRMSCDRLRPQVARLRESLLPSLPSSTAAASTAGSSTPSGAMAAAPTAPRPSEFTRPLPSNPLAPPPSSATPRDSKAITASTSCAQDEARLTKLRANPSRADLLQLERDLGCERLRPQIVRLRESLLPAAPGPAGAVAVSERSTGLPVERQAEPNPPLPRTTTATQPPVSASTCEMDRATLTRLRARPSRDEVLRFERELGCEPLRPQVMRLRESLSGG